MRISDWSSDVCSSDLDLRAAGHDITHVDLGGGLGVPYKPDDNPPSPADYGAMVARVTTAWDVTLMFEPGRVIAGNTGVLLTAIFWVKPGATNPFVILNRASNDPARPAPPDPWHAFVRARPTSQTRYPPNLR